MDKESIAPVRLGRRALMLGGASLIPSIVFGQSTPSANPEKLEHVFAMTPASWNPWIATLETRIPDLMAQTSVPGLSIVLIRDAKIYWRHGFGIRDAETRQPVDNNTVFEAASMSKPVFAYVVMKLAEQGTIGLDTPLTRYTPVKYVPDDPQLDRITTRHVLMHATGFPNWRSKESPMRISFTPGERYSYSGEGYSYLQSVVTHLTGKEDRNRCGNYENDVSFCATDIGDFMRAHLLRPFRMDSSAYLWSEQIAKNLARPHGSKGDAHPLHKTTPVDASRYAAAGGLLTTPTDYARFLIEVIQPRPSDAFRLSKSSVDEMTRPQIDVGNFPGYSVARGLGWRIVRMANDRVIGHGGANPGFQCFSGISPAKKSGFVIMTNADSGSELLQLLAPTVLGS